ncbi:hypothetical protein [Bradyrhizobium sp.]|uniref:hypothetical protein n=1 Tax=Bradyrhizobium sp. TaxID=376 RepID=UPI001D50DAC4|nr:hypothetical protein [Bradyrhizobium sp.]MBV8701349.1 hypothetical protein [Bradyrhizobium sp.]MBV8917292.1 hypothetical protein [Bradyrhizobium sp.]MBV9980515.1 hypothetical protein [Bradyrhizobium sp.]
MPINRLLMDGKLAPGEAERLNRALKLVLGTLHLVDRNDPLTDLIAKKVIEVGASGVEDPKEISSIVIKQLRIG